ncbi:hypothetical protein [Niallia circulans]|uniref:hypothetical protein n=1 Tax=Niallia circulans TaxID=1397 RepID=UPI001560FC7F|nr:hypothetical protein [Niallia circulans]NRG33933.1 hypothetical protein [Niallia circulans]
MEKAVLNTPFSMVQWHGEDYPYYEEDSLEGTFKKGDTVLVLHEAEPNIMGRLFVIFNERINESAVVTESYLDFIKEESQ